MVQYIYFYNITTGRIEQSLTADLSIDTTAITRNIRSGESSYVSNTEIDQSQYYFVSGLPTQRPIINSVASWNKTSAQANGTDSVILGSGLPSNSVVDIVTPINSVNNSLNNSITSGSITLTSTIVTNYTINITAFPYQDYSSAVYFVSGSVLNISVPSFGLTITMYNPSI